MKCTWPTQEMCVWDTTQPIFHGLAFGFGIGGNTKFRFGVRGNSNFRVFRYQHVGVGNAKWLRRGLTQGPSTSGFALQWNIGLNVYRHFKGDISIYIIIPKGKRDAWNIEWRLF